MDMMEMMDDQDGRDLSCSFSPSASLFLCWIPLSLCLSVFLYGTTRRATPVRCSKQRVLLCVL